MADDLVGRRVIARHSIERRPRQLRMLVAFDLGHLLRPDATDAGVLAEVRRFLEGDVLPDLLEIVTTLRGEDEIGTVKFFREDRGYGYITSQDRQDVFVHWSGIEGDGFKSLTSGDRVRFKRRVGTRSIEAFDVRPLGVRTGEARG